MFYLHLPQDNCIREVKIELNDLWNPFQLQHAVGLYVTGPKRSTATYLSPS